jgi:4-hydroxyphenylacetate 3-monooxygenase
MLRTGKEHLETLRDGRVVYVGGERIDDVTRHPAFRNAAQTVAAIYDMKADPANRDTMSYEGPAGATPSISCGPAPATICSDAWWRTRRSPT